MAALKAQVHDKDTKIGAYLRSRYQDNKAFFCEGSMISTLSRQGSPSCSPHLQDVIEWICENAAKDLPPNIATFFGNNGLRVGEFYVHLHQNNEFQENEGSAPWLEPKPLPTFAFYTPGWSLTEYQQKSIAWMLWREQQGGREVVSPVWTPLPHNTKVLFNRTTGKLAHKCDYDQCRDNAKDICGGILGDAPGLGKTRMVLTVVCLTKRNLQDALDWPTKMEPKPVPAPPRMPPFLLCVQCSRRDHHVMDVSGTASMHSPFLPFLCKECCPDKQTTAPKATIIVVPESLLTHWVNEMLAVLQQGSLKALVYAQQRVLGKRLKQFSSGALVNTTSCGGIE